MQNLIFNGREIKNRSRGLTFDDVLLVPQKSEIRSRKQPSLQTQITKTRKIEIPLISSNMDTVTESEMMIAMHQLGGLGILHRFMTIDRQVDELKKAQKAGALSAASIGVNEDFTQRAEALVKAGCEILVIDIAHGHSVTMIEVTEWLKKTFPMVDVIAGNVATPEGVIDLIKAGADCIKVGIGPGSMCTTRIITGCGVPQLTAIALAAEMAGTEGIPIIADGGIRTSGDAVKALAAGAQTVMLGGMLAGTIETPGEIVGGRKVYRGMASRSAQDSWRGGVPQGMAPEGESTFVPVKGHVAHVIHEIAGGIRSAMSYINATQVSEIAEKSRFIEISYNGVSENRAHGVRT